MNDAQSTIAGLKAQACPGGGWNGMPAELEGKATVADCVTHGVCGCIYGDAVQHIEALRAALIVAEEWVPAPWTAYTPEGKAQAEQVYKALGWSVDQQPQPSETKP